MITLSISKTLKGFILMEFTILNSKHVHVLYTNMILHVHVGKYDTVHMRINLQVHVH